MRFERRAPMEYGLGPIDIVPWVDVVFQLLIFFMLTSAFAVQAGINVKLPRTITSDIIKEESIVVIISGEDVLSFNNQILTSQELRRELAKLTSKNRLLLIKADRRSSVGRIVEVWNLCRELGIERINIATNEEQ